MIRREHGGRSCRCTDDRDNETKNGLYAQFQEVIDRLPRVDKVVATGDFIMQGLAMMWINGMV